MEGNRLAGIAETVGLVFLGGALGSVARFSLGLVWHPLWSLIAINLVGAFALGWLYTSRWLSGPRAKEFWGTGFAGGFTSMSAVALLFVQSSLVDITVYPAALLLLHLPLGVACYLLGKRAGGARPAERGTGVGSGGRSGKGGGSGKSNGRQAA